VKNNPSPLRGSRPNRGFVSPDLFILAAVLGVILAVVLPQAFKHGWRGALLAFFLMVGVLLAILGLILGAAWLLSKFKWSESGWQGHLSRWGGHLLRLLVFGIMTSILGSCLMLWHGLSLTAENGVAVGSGILGGVCGDLLHHRLGPARFWPAFGLFCLALLGSLFGGMLGILGPGNWGVDLGILLPILVFAILAARGRIVPPPGGASPPNATSGTSQE
jgi:MFS family permease